jgi:hypothetical protein
MKEAITFAFYNFSLTFFLLGLLAAVIALAAGRKPLSRPVIVEALLSYYCLFAIGLSFLYNFVVHVFFGEVSARFIGWAQSPFQAEVGFASLGFALVGLLAFKGSPGLRLAAVVGPAMFSLGCGRRAHLPDDQHAQFRAGECRHCALHRHRPADRRPCAALAAARIHTLVPVAAAADLQRRASIHCRR